MSQRRHPPNRLLAWERLQRGWSYEELAERIRTSMAQSGETDTGLTANTARRWETGERWPDPRYRKHLVTILGRPASELGLLTPDELALRPEAGVLDELRSLFMMNTSDASGGGINRAAVLRGLLSAGTLPLLAPLLSLQPDITDEVAARPMTDPESYASITRSHQRLYWTTPARSLYEAAYAHTKLGVDILRGASANQRAAVAGAVAESALLTARLAFFDLAQSAVAQRCFEVALAATRDAADHALAAGVLGHMAFVPAFSGDPDGARSLLAAAFQHTWHGVSPVVRSWLHCVSSEVEGRAGVGGASRHQIDLAAAALGPENPAPDWMDFYDAGRLNSFAGYAALAAGDKTDAVDHLTKALDCLGANGAKQRSVVLADLAATTDADVDRAANYLHQAIDALNTDWYGTGFTRVRTARAVLSDSREGAQLDERIRAITETGRASLAS